MELVFEGGGGGVGHFLFHWEDDTFVSICKNVDYSPQCVAAP